MNRRTFLKTSALGAGTLTIGNLSWSFARQGTRSLIVVANAGDAQTGTAPSLSLIDAESYEVVGEFSVAQPYSFPATRWDFRRDLLWG